MEVAAVEVEAGTEAAARGDGTRTNLGAEASSGPGLREWAHQGSEASVFDYNSTFVVDSTRPTSMAARG